MPIRRLFVVVLLGAAALACRRPLAWHETTQGVRVAKFACASP
ncbi:hypothetical protein BH11MYX4_BH11MYX4_18130 [soil metagenome]